MNVFEIRFSDGWWCLRQAGAMNNARVESKRECLEAFVDGYMSQRAGKVIFYTQDGAVDREAVYEPHDMHLWSRGFAAGA